MHIPLRRKRLMIAALRDPGGARRVSPAVRAGLGVALLMLSLVSPPGAAARAQDRARPDALARSALSWCGEVEPVRAPESAYRDRPVYLENEMPLGVVRGWARAKPGYEDIWIDRENLGWLTVAFSRGVAKRQAELRRRFPEVGVVAVKAPQPKSKLRELTRQVERVMQEFTWQGSLGFDMTKGIVELWVQEPTPELVARLEGDFAGEPLCLDAPDPARLVQPGPQAQAGEGWRLLGTTDVSGPPWEPRTSVAADPASYVNLWQEALMAGTPPEVDFEREVAVLFVDPHGSSCPHIRLDGVNADAQRRLVFPSLVDPDNPVACTLDLAGANRFVVALERDRLPAPPFIIQLDPWDPPSEPSLARTVVEADLREPGAVGSPAEIHPDRGERPPLPERSGAFIDVGRWTRFALDASCGLTYLGEINGVHWVARPSRIPDKWRGLVDDSGELIVHVRLVGGADPHADARRGGHRVRYEPQRGAPERCLTALALVAMTVPTMASGFRNGSFDDGAYVANSGARLSFMAVPPGSNVITGQDVGGANGADWREARYLQPADGDKTKTSIT